MESVKKIHLLDPQLKDKDGDGGADDVLNFNVEVASNGFCLTILFDDGSELKEVYTSIDDVIRSIRANL